MLAVSDWRDVLAAPARELRRIRGFAPLPWGIDLLLTDACNLRCTYCPIAAEMQAHRPRAFVDTRKAIRFLESVAHFRPMIRMFGGEPFLHPEWQRIFAAAVGLSIPITAVTNGSTVSGRAEELVRCGLLAIGFSVDPPEANDRHRGEGTFAACQSAIREIAAARAKLGSSTPQIEIYTTVHEGTVRHLTDWAERLAGWNIDTLRLQQEIWLRSSQRAPSEELIRSAIGDSSFFGGEVDGYCREAIGVLDPAVLEEELRQLEAIELPFKLDLYPSAREMLRSCREARFDRSTARPCTLISTYTFVDPEGRLYPCLTLDMGNVFERPFEEVWNGPKFRAFRRLLRQERRLPLCERCPS